jgi:hypothetical protein
MMIFFIIFCTTLRGNMPFLVRRTAQQHRGWSVGAFTLYRGTFLWALIFQASLSDWLFQRSAVWKWRRLTIFMSYFYSTTQRTINTKYCPPCHLVIVNPHTGGYGLASQTLSPTSGISPRVVLPRCRSLPLWCLSTSSASTLFWIRAKVWSNSLRSHSFLAEYFSEPAGRSLVLSILCHFFKIQKAHSTSLLMFSNFVENCLSG